MKNTHLFLLGLASSTLLAITALSGCGNSDTGSGGSGGTGPTSSSTSMQSTGSQTSSGSSMFPAAPKIGMQIDRTGRPAVNAALNHTFDVNMMTQGAARDAYNAASDSSKWAATFGKDFGMSLAVFDGLDTKCGNQILADPDPTKRYVNLSNAMADDRLWLKTDAAMCTLYLGVELDATMIQKNADCGGRKLDYDPIDVSFTALTGSPMPVTDGVSADADTKGTTFPYLAAPH